MPRVLVVLVSALLAGCGFLTPAMPHQEGFEPVGPRIQMGPIPTFDADGNPTGGDTMMVFFRTADGWCTETDGGGGCAGGGGLPTGFGGIGGSESGDETCMEAVTGNEVARVVVRPGNLDEVTLQPLAGSGNAPVNVFAACWEARIGFENLEAHGFTVDGTRVSP